MNKYLEKIASRQFTSPEEIKARLQPASFRNLQWDGKETIDPNERMKAHASASAATRAERLTKAKSLLSKKVIKTGIKTGLIAGGGMAAYHLGKSIMNNYEA